MRKYAFVIGLAAWLLIAAPASAANITYTPSTVTPGASMTVSGTVPIPGCPVPGNAIVVPDSPLSNGSDVVAVPYDNATGHFDVQVTLSPTITLGTHSFLVRCAGRNEPVGPVAGAEIGGPFPTFTVVGLARTGGSIGPLSDTAAVAMAVALVAIGCAAVLMGRRRNTTRE